MSDSLNLLLSIQRENTRLRNELAECQKRSNSQYLLAQYKKAMTQNQRLKDDIVLLRRELNKFTGDKE